MALGFIESPFFGLTAIIADHAAKAADVRLLGIETTGNENLMIRLEGAVASVNAALESAAATAEHLGSKVITQSIGQPASGLQPLVSYPNIQNSLYGGRDQFLPTDYTRSSNSSMSNQKTAIGILETQGLTAILEATDAMLKAANVTLVGKEKIGAAYVTVIIKGDVAAVTAAIQAGERAVGGLGKLIAVHVIARPHEDLNSLLPK